MAVIAWLYWLPRTETGEKNRFAMKKNPTRSPTLVVGLGAQDPPAADEEQDRQEELAVELQERDEQAVSLEDDRVEPVSGPPPSSAKIRAFSSCRTKPCVTRMPRTDSASVAVTRLKDSRMLRRATLSLLWK